MKYIDTKILFDNPEIFKSFSLYSFGKQYENVLHLANIPVNVCFNKLATFLKHCFEYPSYVFYLFNC